MGGVQSPHRWDVINDRSLMARDGLSLVRDALVTATVYDVIDDDEFVLLDDVYSPRSGNSQIVLTLTL